MSWPCAAIELSSPFGDVATCNQVFPVAGPDLSDEGPPPHREGVCPLKALEPQPRRRGWRQGWFCSARQATHSTCRSCQSTRSGRPVTQTQILHASSSTSEVNQKLVGRDGFTLAFKTANQADFEQIFSQIQAEVELQSSSKSAKMGVPEHWPGVHSTVRSD